MVYLGFDAQAGAQTNDETCRRALRAGSGGPLRSAHSGVHNLGRYRWAARYGQQMVEGRRDARTLTIQSQWLMPPLRGKRMSAVAHALPHYLDASARSG
jgi:hypothetical protein